MARLKVSFINKGNRVSRYERISSIGGISTGARWKHSAEDVINAIANNINSYFIEVKGVQADFIIASHLGKKYLGVSDAVTIEKVLSFPEMA